MNSKFLNVDSLNTGLIIVSFILAYLLPFEVFIVAYAFLGPLHYFTEINWIQENNYFTTNRYWKYLIISAAALLALPYILFEFLVPHLSETDSKVSIISNAPRFFNGLLFLSLIGAFVLIFIKSIKNRILILGVSVALMILFHFLEFYHLIIGLLLPTLIHVYVFTVLFMCYGYSKSKTNFGLANIILMLSVPLLIWFVVSYENHNYVTNQFFKTTYLDNNFVHLNVSLSKLLGLSDGKSFYFYESLFLKLQMFIAFAYIYHYLNWFSKTTIIKWHKNLNFKRISIILVLWIASIALFFYNYKVGLVLLIGVSFLHVMLEFPLNFITIKQLFSKSKT